MLDKKAEAATAASYVVSGSGFGVGTWFADHWLQLFMAGIALATYLTNRHYQKKADRRAEEAHRESKAP